MSEPPTRDVRLDDSTTPPGDPLSIFVLEDSLSGAGPQPVAWNAPSVAPPLEGMARPRVAAGIARAAPTHGTALKPAKADPVALRTDFDQLRELGTQLASEYERIAEAGRETGQRTEIAAQTISALEARLRDLTALHDIYSITDRTAVNVDGQGAAVTEVREEPATPPTGPAVDDRPLARAEEMVSRLEQCVAESTARLEQLARVKSDLESELDRLQRQAHTLKASIDQDSRRLAVVKQSSARNRSLVPVAPVISARTGTSAGLSWRRLNVYLSRISTPKPAVPVRAFRAVCATLIILVVAAVAMTRTLVTQAQPGIAATRPARMLSTAIRPALPSVTLPSGMLTLTIPDPSPIQALSTVQDARSSFDAAPPTHAIESGASPRLIARRSSRVATREPDRDARSEDGVAADSDAPGVFIGELAIQSNPPGAVVYVDRQRVGQTPLQLRSVRAGSHVVAVERDGFQRWSRAVLVPADERTRISATLQPQ